MGQRSQTGHKGFRYLIFMTYSLFDYFITAFKLKSKLFAWWMTEPELM